MNLSTTLNKKNRAVSRSIDALFAARSFGSLSKDLHERLREAIADMGKAPEWAREYVRGYQDCLTKALYHTVLIFGGYVDGVFYSVEKDRPDYYEKNGMGPKDWHDRATAKGHYWQETITKTGYQTRGIKPFFISDVLSDVDHS